MKIAGFIAAAGFCLGGCTTAPPVYPERTVALPLAAAHSDITFMLTTGSRQQAICAELPVCRNEGDAASGLPTPNAVQVQRVARALQHGVARLYPGLALRIPGLTDRGFDVYIAAGDEPGSVSSASGRIALSAAFGVSQPYDDWLAFVIAREMGHVIARHHEENSSVSIATSVIMNILIPGSGLLKSAASTIGAELAVGSTRDQQAREADAIALNLLQAAGYDLHAVALSLAIASAGLGDGSWSQGFRKSSAQLIARTRGSRFADASDSAAAGSTR
jgi:Zn-dependent protease with chaperone function